MIEPALLARILTLPVVASEQDLRRPYQQLLQRYSVALERPLPEAGQGHPLSGQPFGSHASTAAAQPDRIVLTLRPTALQVIDPGDQSSSLSLPAESPGHGADARLDILDALGEGKVQGRDIQLFGYTHPVPRSTAHGEDEIGPVADHRKQAAFILFIVSRPFQQGGFALFMREIRNHTDLSRRGEQKEQWFRTKFHQATRFRGRFPHPPDPTAN